jgi:hypothetical protein
LILFAPSTIDELRRRSDFEGVCIDKSKMEKLSFEIRHLQQYADWLFADLDEQLTPFVSFATATNQEPGYLTWKTVSNEALGYLTWKEEKVPLTRPINWGTDFGKVIGSIIQDSLNSVHSKNSEVHFSSEAIPYKRPPYEVNKDYKEYICTILSLNRSHYSQVYTLKQSVNYNPRSTSLLNLAIDIFLQNCRGCVQNAANNQGYSLDSPEVMLTSAARELMMFWKLSDQITPQPENIVAYSKLYNDCNKVSNLPYEKRQCRGAIFIAAPNHPNIFTKVHFTPATPLTEYDYRLARKLLEMAQGKLSLLCDGEKIYGLGELRDNDDLGREDLFKIEFTGQSTWKLFYGDKEMLSVEFGKPRLPTRKTSFKENFETKFHEQFQNNGKVANVYELVEAVKKQMHGALIIVSAEAKLEAQLKSGHIV